MRPIKIQQSGFPTKAYDPLPRKPNDRSTETADAKASKVASTRHFGRTGRSKHQQTRTTSLQSRLQPVKRADRSNPSSHEITAGALAAMVADGTLDTLLEQTLFGDPTAGFTISRNALKAELEKALSGFEERHVNTGCVRSLLATALAEQPDAAYLIVNSGVSGRHEIPIALLKILADAGKIVASIKRQQKAALNNGVHQAEILAAIQKDIGVDHSPPDSPAQRTSLRLGLIAVLVTDVAFQIDVINRAAGKKDSLDAEARRMDAEQEALDGFLKNARDALQKALDIQDSAVIDQPARSAMESQRVFVTSLLESHRQKAQERAAAVTIPPGIRLGPPEPLDRSTSRGSSDSTAHDRAFNPFATDRVET